MADTAHPNQDLDQGLFYHIRIEGRLGPQWTEWFGDVTIVQTTEGNTLLACQVPDQAALFGLLRKVRDLGMPLLSVTLVKPEPPDASEQTL